MDLIIFIKEKKVPLMIFINLWFYKMSTLGELYRKIIFNDETCIQFLKDHELLTNTKLCTKLNSVRKQCNSEMKETFKKSQKRDVNGDVIITKYLRCKKRVVKHGNPFVKKNHFLLKPTKMEKIIVV